MSEMKENRREVIAGLIRTAGRNRQEELIALLEERGISAAQATVSRDLRILGAKKRPGPGGVPVYYIPEGREEGAGRRFNYSESLAPLLIRSDFAGNTVVLKTITGMAGAVAVGIDGMEYPGILGCVAGDDTIIVVTSDSSKAAEVSAAFSALCTRGQGGVSGGGGGGRKKKNA